MKTSVLTTLVAALSVFTLTLKAQNGFKEGKYGHVFYMSVPEYMTRTLGLNDDACVQYQSIAKDVYTFVIEDPKEDLDLVDIKFGSIKEFYDYFAKDFLSDAQDRMIAKPKTYTMGKVNFIQTEATYYDADVKGKIYYLVTIVETPTHYYKILSYTSADNRDTVKDDLVKMANSFRD